MKSLAETKKHNKTAEPFSYKGLGKKKHSQNNIRLRHQKVSPKYENLTSTSLGSSSVCGWGSPRMNTDKGGQYLYPLHPKQLPGDALDFILPSSQ